MRSQLEEVNSPSHYRQGKIETIDCIESILSPEEFKGYLKGCVIKYYARELHKGGYTDLAKAQWYANKLIEKENKCRQQKTSPQQVSI